MTSLSSLTDPYDVREIFFTNLLLLGFDSVKMEEKYKITFSKDMFAVPNKRAMEIVMQFLLMRLDPDLCKEQLRDCWPILDKKQEQVFRKTCNNWLSRIAKEEESANLPRVVPSFFMSPGGDRFYDLLFMFSTHVLRRVMIREHTHGIACHLRCPVASPNTAALSPVIVRALQARITMHRQRFLETTRHLKAVREKWAAYAVELTAQHRELSRLLRSLEQKLQELESAEHNLLSSSVSKLITPSQGVLRLACQHGERAVQARHQLRLQQIGHLRQLRSQLEQFIHDHMKHCALLDAVLSRDKGGPCLDAASAELHIPDLLLQQCQQQLQEKVTGNTIDGGKINLLSVVQVWNVSLERLSQDLRSGIMDLSTLLSNLNSHTHTHRAQLASAQTLRAELAKRTIPELQVAAEQARHEVALKLSGDAALSVESSARALPQRLSLLPASPGWSFSPTKTPESVTPVSQVIASRTAGVTSTPEVVDGLLESIQQKTAAGPSRVAHHNPKTAGVHFSSSIGVFSPLGSKSTVKKHPTMVRQSSAASHTASKLGSGMKSSLTTRTPAAKRSAPLARQLNFTPVSNLGGQRWSDRLSAVQPSTISHFSMPQTSDRSHVPLTSLQEAISPQRYQPVASHHQSLPKDNSCSMSFSSGSPILSTPRTGPGVRSIGRRPESVPTHSGVAGVHKRSSAQHKEAVAKAVEKQLSPAKQSAVTGNALDSLAEQIASSMSVSSKAQTTADWVNESSLDDTPEEVKLHAVADPLVAMDREAFVSRDRLPRTPPRTSHIAQEIQQVATSISPGKTAPLDLSKSTPMSWQSSLGSHSTAEVHSADSSFVGEPVERQREFSSESPAGVSQSMDSPLIAHCPGTAVTMVTRSAQIDLLTGSPMQLNSSSVNGRQPLLSSHEFELCKSLPPVLQQATTAEMLQHWQKQLQELQEAKAVVHPRVEGTDYASMGQTLSSNEASPDLGASNFAQHERSSVLNTSSLSSGAPLTTSPYSSNLHPSDDSSESDTSPHHSSNLHPSDDGSESDTSPHHLPSSLRSPRAAQTPELRHANNGEFCDLLLETPGALLHRALDGSSDSERESFEKSRSHAVENSPKSLLTFSDDSFTGVGNKDDSTNPLQSASSSMSSLTTAAVSHHSAETPRASAGSDVTHLMTGNSDLRSSKPMSIESTSSAEVSPAHSTPPAQRTVAQDAPQQFTPRGNETLGHINSTDTPSLASMQKALTSKRSLLQSAMAVLPAFPLLDGDSFLEESGEGNLSNYSLDSHITDEQLLLQS